MKTSFFDDTFRPLIVVATESPWEEPPRLRYYLTQQLLKRHNVLYVELYKRDRIVKRISGSLIVATCGRYRRGVNRLSLLKWIFDIWQASYIAKLVYQTGYDQGILFNFQFDFPQLMKKKSLHPSFFVCNDDFINLNPYRSEAWKRGKHKLQARVVSASDGVIATSEQLLDAVCPTNKKRLTLLSGHDFAIDLGPDIPRKDPSSIRVCFLGYIDRRLPFDWFTHLIETDESLKLTLVGPLQDELLIAQLRQRENFAYSAPLLGENLRQLLMAQDVFLMLYASDVDNSLTSMPAKLVQYLACGRPVVANGFDNLLYLCDDTVYMVNNIQDLVPAIRKAWSNDTAERRRMRKTVALGHTWDQRGKELRSFMEKVRSDNS